MKLLPLTLISPKIQVSEVFPVLELIMSHQAISESIAETNSIGWQSTEQFSIFLIRKKMDEFLEIYGSRKGTKAAFPKARLVILVELGTSPVKVKLIKAKTHAQYALMTNKNLKVD